MDYRTEITRLKTMMTRWLATWLRKTRQSSPITQLGWLLLVGGWGGEFVNHTSQLGLGSRVIVGCSIALAIMLVLIFGQMKRMFYPSSFLERVGLLARASCVVAGTFCAWAGLWLLTCAFWGLIFLTLSRKKGYTLLVPLLDDRDFARNSNPAQIWACVVINGDGVDIAAYSSFPQSSEQDPTSRVLVEHYEQQIRVLAWRQGADVDDDPSIVEVLAEDIVENPSRE